MMKQDMILTLKKWIGNHIDEIIQLRTWPLIYKFIHSGSGLTPTAQEVYDLVFPEKIKSCDHAKFSKFSIGYQFCHKNCDCYTKHMSNTLSMVKSSMTEDDKKKANDRRVNTVKQKYGVENVFLTDSTKDKIRDTKLEKYGNPTFTNPTKAAQTSFDRYGVYNVMQVQDVKDKNVVGRDYQAALVKGKATKLLTYGDENYRNFEQTQITNIQRYGVSNPAKSQVVKDKISTKLREIFLPRHSEKYKIEPTFEVHEYLPGKNNTWICKKCKTEISGIVDSGKFTRCKVCYPYGSMEENQVKDYLRELGCTVIENSRTLIKPYEIDIFLPEYKLAIEYTGLYFHREGAGKDRHYHLNKLMLCHNAGIRLVTLFSDQWVNNNAITKSRLAQLVNKQVIKIGARQCDVNEITAIESVKFLNENHSQGYCVSAVRYGLFLKGELVAIMTFGKSRFEKNTAELLRFAVKNGMSICGAASKLFARFATYIATFDQVVSYSDNAWGFTSFYSSIGFINVSTGSPGYSYIDLTSKEKGRLTRMRFQKHKLRAIFDDIDLAKSEYTIMQEQGYDRVWDCGHSKWIFNQKT